MVKCPECSVSFYDSEFKAHFKNSHPDAYRKLQERHQEEDSGDFTTSALIGYATNSALLGAVLGGDIVGGIVGDFFNSD